MLGLMMGGISIVGTLCSLCLHALYVLCCKLNIPANNYTDNNLLLLLSKKFFLFNIVFHELSWTPC